MTDFSKEWDKREREFDRRPRHKPRIITKTYLGYGHWIIHYDDGTKELRWVPTPEARAVFYRAEEYTDDGFPIHPEQRR